MIVRVRAGGTRSLLNGRIGHKCPLAVSRSSTGWMLGGEIDRNIENFFVLPNRSNLSSFLASRLSLRSCRSISALIRFCSFCSSLRQQAMVRVGVAGGRATQLSLRSAHHLTAAAAAMAALTSPLLCCCCWLVFLSVLSHAMLVGRSARLTAAPLRTSQDIPLAGKPLTAARLIQD